MKNTVLINELTLGRFSNFKFSSKMLVSQKKISIKNQDDLHSFITSHIPLIFMVFHV